MSSWPRERVWHLIRQPFKRPYNLKTQVIKIIPKFIGKAKGLIHWHHQLHLGEPKTILQMLGCLPHYRWVTHWLHYFPILWLISGTAADRWHSSTSHQLCSSCRHSAAIVIGFWWSTRTHCHPGSLDPSHRSDQAQDPSVCHNLQPRNIPCWGEEHTEEHIFWLLEDLVEDWKHWSITLKLRRTRTKVQKGVRGKGWKKKQRFAQGARVSVEV